MISAFLPSLMPPLALAGSHTAAIRSSLDSYPEFDGMNWQEIRAVAGRNASWMTAYQGSMGFTHNEHIKESAMELKRVRSALQKSPEFIKLSEAERDEQIYQLAGLFAPHLVPSKGDYVFETLNITFWCSVGYGICFLLGMIFHVPMHFAIEESHPQHELLVQDLPRMFPAICITSFILWGIWHISRQAPENREKRDPHDRSGIVENIMFYSVYGVSILVAFDAPLSVILPTMLAPIPMAPFLYKTFTHPHEMTKKLISKSAPPAPLSKS